MTNLKRVSFLMLPLILVFALLATSVAPAPTLAAPPSEEPEELVDTSQYKKDSPWTVCFSNASVSNSWRVSMVEHVRYEASLHPEIEVFLETDAEDKPDKQISDTEDLLAKGCDVLIISPATQEALTPVTDKAMEMGVPVVTLDRNVSGDNYVSFVESSNCDMGREQAEWLVGALDGKGKIVLLSGIAGASPAEDRLTCAREVFAEYPDIEELAQAYANWSPVEGKQVMENWLTTFDQIDGVWSDSALQGSGAVEAFAEAGLDVPPITGEDFNRYLKQWKELGFEGVSVSFPVRMGRAAVLTAVDILNGEPVEHYVNVPRTIITKDNLDDFVRTDLPDDYWGDTDSEVAEILFGEAAASEESEELVDTSQYKKDSPWTVCFSNASVSNSWRVSMVEHVRYEASLHPEIEVFLETDAEDKPDKQISDTEDLLAKGCDVLIISPATQEALTPVTDKAMEMGVPVVTLDRNVSGDNYVSFVESSNCDMGREQAEWLVGALDGKGKIVLLSGIAGASPAEDRLTCAREVFAEYPDIEELAQAYANWSPVEGKQVMENWLTTFDQIDGVWSDSALQGSGAVEAFAEAGLDVPPITGEDFNRYLKQWKELGFEGVSVSFPVRMGRAAVLTAVDILNGEPVEHYVNVPRTIITKDNLDDFVRTDLPDDYWGDTDSEVAEILFGEQ